jgi:4-hydroxy-tetrahydrodipicolinate synthase
VTPNRAAPLSRRLATSALADLLTRTGASIRTLRGVLFDAPAVLPALLTPFEDAGAVDRAALRDHLEFVIEGGVDGVMPCGTTREAAMLEADEVLELVAAAVKAAAGRVKLVGHVGRPSTRATQRLIKRMKDVGVDAVAAVVPYYYAFDDAQLVAHYRALLETAGETPLFAYTFPARTGTTSAPPRSPRWPTTDWRA